MSKLDEIIKTGQFPGIGGRSAKMTIGEFRKRQLSGAEDAGVFKAGSKLRKVMKCSEGRCKEYWDKLKVRSAGAGKSLFNEED